MTRQFEDEHLPESYQAAADRMNIDENAIPDFDVPPLPIPDDCTPELFEQAIRPRLVEACAQHFYGHIPPMCNALAFKTTAEGMAFDGLAVRREIDIVCENNGIQRVFHLLLYIPAAHKGKIPVFFGLNFRGNHATTADTGVTFHPFKRYPDSEFSRLRDGRSDESQRGVLAGRWNFEKVLKAGYATATICYYDICPDLPYAVGDGIYPMFYSQEQWSSSERDFSAISAWAWGISRAFDCLETQPELDSSRIILHGLSRLGKVALWAGANDTRAAIVIANCSGALGDKLSHHYFGESIEWLYVWNPHWFRGDFGKWVGRELELPIDQHFLMAASAPRPVMVTNATEDIYADPEGEFLTCIYATPAWEACGLRGIPCPVFPPVGHLWGERIGYYLRAGEHNVTPETWDAMLAFVKKNLANTSETM